MNHIRNGTLKKKQNKANFQRRDLIKFCEQINLTPTNPVTSYDAQILIMKMLSSVLKTYLFPRGLCLCVCEQRDIGHICGHFPVIFF
jgi:hypothetical protein